MLLSNNLFSCVCFESYKQNSSHFISTESLLMLQLISYSCNFNTYTHSKAFNCIQSRTKNVKLVPRLLYVCYYANFNLFSNIFWKTFKKKNIFVVKLEDFFLVLQLTTYISTNQFNIITC